MTNNGSNTNKDKLNKLAADNSIPSEIKNLISYYKKSLLFNSSLLNKEFIIYNQKAKDRVDIYLFLMTTFNQKNAELLKLLAANQHE